MPRSGPGSNAENAVILVYKGTQVPPELRHSVHPSSEGVTPSTAWSRWLQLRLGIGLAVSGIAEQQESNMGAEGQGTPATCGG